MTKKKMECANCMEKLIYEEGFCTGSCLYDLDNKYAVESSKVVTYKLSKEEIEKLYGGV